MDRYRYSEEERAVLEGLQQPLAVYQLVDGKVLTVLVSDGFCRLYGYGSHEDAVRVMDGNMYGNIHPDDRERISADARRFSAGTDGTEEYDVLFRTKSGAETGHRVIHAMGRHVTAKDGTRLAHIWYMDEGRYIAGDENEGTEANRRLNSILHEESILRAANYDSLTGLPNLAYFFKLCEIRKTRAFRDGKQACLLYIDLNGMKYFNHRYGFAQGDRMLKEFAALLTRTFGPEDCCHIGADRFAAFTIDEGLEGSLMRLFEKFGQAEHHLPVRVGIYSADPEDVPVSSAYDRAKMACDAIPQTGTSTFRRYTAELGEIDRRRRYVESNIDRAIREKWIRVHCQAIIRAVNEKVCNEEALSRWVDPEGGMLSPAEFIPQLEASGQIYKLDLYVLEQVLGKLRKQEELGMPIVPHSFNLSRSDFGACDIVEEIRRRVDEAGVSRDLIIIEITESVIGRDTDFIGKQVARFRSLGFPVWLDDFGSGYSSLDVLQSIRFDLVKFDMNFVRRLNEGEEARIVLTEMVRLVTSLGIDTICEGVETEEQLRFLQEIGCTKLQGFYYCRPLPIEEIIDRFVHGLDVGFEDPRSAAYYETLGRINLYDLDTIAGVDDEDSFRRSFKTIPMGVVGLTGDKARFIRSNPSYRLFIRRFFGINLTLETGKPVRFTAPFMHHMENNINEPGARFFFDEELQDGSVIHSFGRRIGRNPVNGEIAVAIAVLSITGDGQGIRFPQLGTVAAGRGPAPEEKE